MNRDHHPLPARLHMVGNAHIDAMWIWDWREGMHEVLQTFRSAVDRLDEEPALVFTASSASYYQWVEQVSPELFGRIRELVDQQRWIVTGGQWVEPDCNLPSGESVCRQFLYGQRYLAEHLGITATVGYNIDSFGHAGTLPQLLAASGIGAYVMMRPGEHEKQIDGPAFLWEGVDGTALPAYRIPYEYSTEGSHEDEFIRKRSAELLKRSRELGYPLMAFFGVGDHGGGPTRLAVGTIRDLSTTSTGSITFSGPVAYFEDLRGAVARGDVDLPSVTGELQWHAVGCYSVRASLKRGNARAEDALVAAEKMAELCRALTGRGVGRTRGAGRGLARRTVRPIPRRPGRNNDRPRHLRCRAAVDRSRVAGRPPGHVGCPHDRRIRRHLGGRCRDRRGPRDLDVGDSPAPGRLQPSVVAGDGDRIHPSSGVRGHLGLGRPARGATDPLG